jgi:hypothetical protein
MGQGASSNSNRKSLGYIILGYRVTTSIYTKHHLGQEEKQDNVLFKPYLYGLDAGSLSKDPSSSSNSHGNNRTDSGFLLCEKDSQLWNNLIYVDQTYYSSCFLKSTRRFEPAEDLLIGDALTLDDVAITTIAQDIDLSKRGLGFLSPNIGLLPMIRKLDLYV